MWSFFWSVKQKQEEEMTKLIGVLLLAACACFAADPPPASTAGTVVRIVELKHLKGDRAREMASSLYNVLNPGGVAIYDANLNAVILRGYPAQVEPVIALIRTADAPQANRSADPQAQLRIHLILASPETGKDGPVSPEIQSAVAEMRKSFTFGSYRELDTILVQTRSDGSHLSGVLPLEFTRKEAVSTYEVRIQNAAITDDEVRLRNMRLNVRIPVETGGAMMNMFDTSLETSLTLRKGQKVVVGKLSGEQRKDAIFVVVVADIM